MYRDQKPDSINPKRSRYLQVTKAWEYPSLDHPGELIIKIKLSSGIKDFDLATYDPTHFKVDVSELVGMSYASATEHVLDKKRKYKQFIELIMPEDE